GENQLSPSLIGLSPLSTAHPSGFQPTTVRSSTPCYRGFNLAMDRSLRFRVCPHELNRPVQTGFRSGSDAVRLSLARDEQLAGSECKSHAVNPPTAQAADKAHTACRHTVSGSLSLASRRSFHHSLPVLVHYRSRTSL